MDINYQDYSLRTLKGMRKYHRNSRSNSKHNTLFHYLNTLIKTRQAENVVQVKKDFFSAMMGYITKGKS